MSEAYFVNYAKPDGTHIYDQTHLGPGNEQLIESVDQRVMQVKDGRHDIGQFSLDANGFAFSKVRFNFSDYKDNGKIGRVLYPQVVDWMKSVLGASDVQIFDHTYRSKVRSEMSTHNRAPVKTVHNDYTAKSAEHRLTEETRSNPELRRKRFQFINLWMPVDHKVEESPLAMVDMKTVSASDYHPLKLIYPDRIGELAAISHNPKHQWIYFSEMTPGEALLLKVFDSQMPADLNGVPHSAIEPVEHKPFRHARSSIEIRTIVFFEDH